MGLRCFTDHCVSNTIMQTLREAGHEVARLRERLPVEPPEADVIAKAQQLDATLLSRQPKYWMPHGTTSVWHPT
jgi:hypothetical protein